MKKWETWLWVMLLWLSSAATTTVQAATPAYGELITQWIDASSEVKTVSVDWKAQLEMQESSAPQYKAVYSGEIKTDLDFQEWNMQGQLTYDFWTEHNGNRSGGEQNSFSWLLKGARIYWLMPNAANWRYQDVASQRQDFQELIERMASDMAQYQATLEKYYPLINDLMAVVEDGNQYVATLKSDIDVSAFFTKHQALLDELKSEVTAAARKENPELADRYLSEWDDFFNQETLSRFLALNPRIEVRFDKTTVQLQQVIVDVTYDDQFINGETKTAASSEQNSEAATRTYRLFSDFSLKNYNQAVDFQEPKNAQSEDEALSESSNGQPLQSEGESEDMTLSEALESEASR